MECIDIDIDEGMATFITPLDSEESLEITVSFREETGHNFEEVVDITLEDVVLLRHGTYEAGLLFDLLTPDMEYAIFNIIKDNIYNKYEDYI